MAFFGPSRKKGRKNKPRGPSEQEIAKSLENMVMFIMQEGYEKAKDIESRAEEEYNIHKADEIQRERININREYDMKERKFKIKMLTQSSIYVNNSRLKEINAKQVHIDALINEVRERIAKDLEDETTYGDLLTVLIVECLFKLMEGPVFVRCREKDVAIIEKVSKTCEKTYNDVSGQKMVIKVDKKKFLPASSLGGVECYIANHKIMVSNTLDTRVRQTILNCTPPINIAMFGAKSKQIQF